MASISAGKPSAIQEIFSRSKAIMGVVHCEAFPGSPNYQGKSINKIIDVALKDADAYLKGGIHGLIIENHGDIPFSKPENIGHETAAFMSVITDRIKTRVWRAAGH
ncbi:putative TIM-barrel enzyme [Ewingella americana]